MFQTPKPIYEWILLVSRYTADSDGYRADVSYLTSGPAQETQLPTAAAPPTNYYSNAPFSNGHQSSYVNAEVISNNQPQQHGVLVNVNPYAVGSSSSGAVYHHQNSVVNTATPAPTAPDIFVSTSKPIYGDDHFAPLTANLDYSTSQSGTYVVSAKSTQVHSNYDYSPEYDYRENGLDESAIVQRSTGSNRLLVKEPQALYYKTAKWICSDWIRYIQFQLEFQWMIRSKVIFLTNDECCI